MAFKQNFEQTKDIANQLYQRLRSCDLCPRNCQVNRLDGKRGYCNSTRDVVVFSAFLHQGEEPVISAGKGSGTIFFSGCSLKCAYCQNYKFSHEAQGKIISEEELASLMIRLQGKGAANINLVTPTHFLPQIINALLIAVKNGLTIPIVYNTSGYEREDVIALLEDIVDIYLVDMRYFTQGLAEKYSQAWDYPVVNQKALKLMYKQKNPAVLDDNIMKSGIIVRNLVLPNNIVEAEKILHWIKKNIPGSFVSVMFQYQPYFNAKLHSEINRVLDAQECERISSLVEQLKLNGWVQELNPHDDSLAGVHFNQSFDF